MPALYTPLGFSLIRRRHIFFKVKKVDQQKTKITMYNVPQQQQSFCPSNWYNWHHHTENWYWHWQSRFRRPFLPSHFPFLVLLDFDVEVGLILSTNPSTEALVPYVSSRYFASVTYKTGVLFLVTGFLILVIARYYIQQPLGFTTVIHHSDTRYSKLPFSTILDLGKPLCVYAVATSFNIQLNS